jgi:hypothetical protein
MNAKSGRDIGISGQVRHEGLTLYTNSWALVVGSDKFGDARIPSLQFAEADAVAMAELLPSLGFPEQNITIFLGSRDDVTRERLLTFLQDELNERMEQTDRLLVFIASHGVSALVNEQFHGFLLMPGSELLGNWPTSERRHLDRAPKAALEMKQLLHVIQGLQPRHRLLLVDACCSGFAARSVPGAGNLCANDPRLKRWLSAPVTQVLTAGRSDEIAFESPLYRHGVFTYHLMRGLRGHADTDARGLITFGALANYVRTKVVEEETQQDPQSIQYGDGQFLFPVPQTADELPGFRDWVVSGYMDRVGRWTTVPGATELDLTGAELADLLGKWHHVASAPTRAEALECLCKACAALPPDSAYPRTVYAVRGILNGSWDPDPPAELPEIVAVVEILKSSIKQPEGANTPRRLFFFAKRAWQILLVLEVFPKVEHKPIAYRQKWPLAIRDREWLRGYFEGSSGSADVKALLAPALLDFYDSLSPLALPDWKEEYEGTPLWAAFGKMPQGEPGTLREALRLYGANDRNRADCCRRFLHAHPLPPDCDVVWRMVVHEFAEPALKRIVDPKEVTDFLACLQDKEFGTANMRLRNVDFTVPDWFILLMFDLRKRRPRGPRVAPSSEA